MISIASSMKLSLLGFSPDFYTEGLASSDLLSFFLPLGISKLDPLSTSISANELSFKSDSRSVSRIYYPLLTWFMTSSCGLDWLIEDIVFSFSAITSSSVGTENTFSCEKISRFRSHFLPADPTISFFWLRLMKLISFPSGSTIVESKAYVYTCVCKVGSFWLLVTTYSDAKLFFLRKRFYFFFRSIF